MNRLIIVFIFLFGTSVLEARLVESARSSNVKSGTSTSTVTSLRGRWQTLKGRAKGLWNRFTEKSATSKSSFQASKTEDLSVNPSENGAERSKISAGDVSDSKNDSMLEKQRQIDEKLANIPDYKSEVRGTYKRHLEQTAKSLADKPLFKTKGEIPADASLGTSAHGVPLGNFPISSKSKSRRAVNFKTAKVPRLSIGMVAQVEREEFITEAMKLGIDKFGAAKALKSPKNYSRKELNKIKQKFSRLAKKPKTLRDRKLDMGLFVSQEKLDQLAYTLATTNDSPLRVIDALSSSALKMLAVLIINKGGELCHIVSGYLYDLSKSKEFKSEAIYQLGVCADKMGLHGVTAKNLVHTLASRRVSPTEQQNALALLLKDLPKGYTREVWTSLNKISSSLGSAQVQVKDNFNYLLSKGALRAGKPKGAFNFGQQVSRKSEFYNEAQFILALSLFERNQYSKAAQVFESIGDRLKKKVGTSGQNLEALVYINLGRIYFHLKKYKLSLNNYLKIPKDHSLWVQGLIEQGWVQLGMGDYSGAIGNMYSLHSPYFKAVYIPESFVIRTIGYLSICQYGDAYRTLTFMEKLHSGWLKGMQRFLKTHKKSTKSYQTAKKYLTGKSTRGVDGLPYQVIREVVRQKRFLNLQSSINQFEDEVQQYKFIHNLVKSEQSQLKLKLRQARRRMKKAKATTISSVKKKSVAIVTKEDLKRTLRIESKRIHNIQSRLYFYNKSAKSFKRFQRDGLRKLTKKKNGHKQQAGRAVYQTITRLKQQLVNILDNNEFLRYEIFSGSGENIRYQVAGGKTTKAQRIPAHVRPEKIMNWEFQGEFWADEIGSYRSTLRNNCPQLGSGSVSGVNMNKKGG